MNAVPAGSARSGPLLVAVVALAVRFLVTAARGENPLVYGPLLLLAEATQLTALAALNRRS